MNKNIMLFVWFLKFGLLKQRDEYNIHDHIRARFCPEFIPAEEFDEKEQLLRDTPGPAGIKYASYVGGKVNGLFGSVIAMFALFLPVAVIAAAVWFVYVNFLTVGRVAGVSRNMFAGMNAATAGLIIAHLYKIVYFNRVNRKSLLLILPPAIIFILLPDLTGINNAVLIPFFVLAVIVLGIVCGVIHDAAVKYREKNPSTKYIDPRSRKGKKLRERQLRDEEYALRKYIDDDTIKKRREELEKERLEKEEKNRKFRDGG